MTLDDFTTGWPNTHALQALHRVRVKLIQASSFKQLPFEQAVKLVQCC